MAMKHAHAIDYNATFGFLNLLSVPIVSLMTIINSDLPVLLFSRIKLCGIIVSSKFPIIVPPLTSLEREMIAHLHQRLACSDSCIVLSFNLTLVLVLQDLKVFNSTFLNGSNTPTILSG